MVKSSKLLHRILSLNYINLSPFASQKCKNTNKKKKNGQRTPKKKKIENDKTMVGDLNFNGLGDSRLPMQVHLGLHWACLWAQAHLLFSFGFCLFAFGVGGGVFGVLGKVERTDPVIDPVNRVGRWFNRSDRLDRVWTG